MVQEHPGARDQAAAIAEAGGFVLAPQTGASENPGGNPATAVSHYCRVAAGLGQKRLPGGAFREEMGCSFDFTGTAAESGAQPK